MTTRDVKRADSWLDRCKPETAWNSAVVLDQTKNPEGLAGSEPSIDSIHCNAPPIGDVRGAQGRFPDVHPAGVGRSHVPGGGSHGAACARRRLRNRATQRGWRRARRTVQRSSKSAAATATTPSVAAALPRRAWSERRDAREPPAAATGRGPRDRTRTWSSPSFRARARPTNAVRAA